MQIVEPRDWGSGAGGGSRTGGNESQVLVETNSFLSRLKDEGQERMTIKFGARATANLGVL